jgi:Asp-tRNA(Asn)/Glu-tRNA(Gln) amidotransferase A subunit family amidase
VAPFQPDGLEKARQLWGAFFGMGGAMLLAPMMAGREAELPILKEYLASRAGEPPLTAESLLNTWVESDQLRARMLQQWQKFSVLLCPVSSVPAFRHGERAWPIDGQTVRYLDAMSYTQWFNLLGNPAAVVPVGRSPEGLPIGVQVVGRPYEEEVVLAIASRIEKECGGWQPPPLA